MPLSTDCIENFVNSCAGASPNSLKTQQLTGIDDTLNSASVGCSVATIADLPDAKLNEGRFVFVESCSAYRYSDGAAWTNDYDTTQGIAYGFLIGCGSDSYTAPPGQFFDGNEWSETCTGGFDWKAVGCGGYIRQTAITRTGEIYNWGYRAAECGTLCSKSPVQEYTSSLTDFCYVVDGEYHSMALKPDGTLWAYGGLGYWENFNQNSYKWCNVCCINNCYDACGWTWLDTTYTSVAAGNRHSAVVKSNGELWQQGLHCCGVHGIPSQGICVRTCSSPTQEITSSSNWCCASIGCGWTIGALKTDGTKWGWGTNRFGSLGWNCSFDTISSPVQEASSSTNWCALHTVCTSQFMLKTDGTLWGSGQVSYFGGGSGTCCRSSPIQELGSATNWCAIGGPLAPYQQMAITTTNELYRPCASGSYGWCTDTCAVGKQICGLGGSRSVSWAIEFTCKGFNEP